MIHIFRLLRLCCLTLFAFSAVAQNSVDESELAQHKALSEKLARSIMGVTVPKAECVITNMLEHEDIDLKALKNLNMQQPSQNPEPLHQAFSQSLKHCLEPGSNVSSS